MIRAITFDLDGVYFTEDSFLNFKNSLPVVDSSKLDFLSKSEAMVSFKKGELSENEFWGQARQELNFCLSNQEISDLLANSYQVNPDVVATVKKIRGSGIKTCICTNNFPTRINALQNKFHFLDDFDIKIFSYEIGALKPDPRIFQALIDQSNCQPSEVIYTDDKKANVATAQFLGINAFVYQEFNHFVDKLHLHILH